LRLKGTQLRLLQFFNVRKFAKAEVVIRAIVNSGVCFVFRQKGR